MANKKDIKQFLKNANLTEADIDIMWKDAAEKNTLISTLIKQNIDWRTLNMHCIKQIPDEKENQIKREEDQKIKTMEEEKKKQNELRIAEEKKRSLNDESLFLQRCLNKDLSEKELCSITTGDSIAILVEEVAQGARRWSETIYTYIKVLDRYFCIIWEKGLTENQDNMYYNQPEEVVFTENVITQTVKVWKSKQ